MLTNKFSLSIAGFQEKGVPGGSPRPFGYGELGIPKHAPAMAL